MKPYAAEPDHVVEQSILAILVQSLQISSFQKLELEAQRQTVDEAQKLLKIKSVEMTNKRQLVTFLQGLIGCGAIELFVVHHIENVLTSWNDAPF